ncbi:related to thymidylate kinase [Ustilago bromivora]|uniref:Thymidylate kinase n=1 Tax=Ustilago bromivora TaxID=307758 RepID=A0A1K0H5A7_9BASI|nr:related to thymidylate kinase [Ustilago bromivora]SYW79445.1 related to thymidylate kinase [Ustilago bromivora]
MSSFSPRRKVSMDLRRIKNVPSTLSLRKPDQDASKQFDTIPSSSTFSRLSNLARSSNGSEQADSRTSKRTSRLLDAFKPSRKPAPSFEVVRKPPNRSTTSFHSSTNQPSPQVEILRPVSRLSIHNPPDAPAEPAPRISLSAPHPDPLPQLTLSNTDALLTAQSQNALNTRSQYPPSTTRTRRLSSNLTGGNSTRRTSDSYLNLGSASHSRAQSPSASPNVDGVNSSFSLHSFRNVRSASDVSNVHDPSTQTHSRVHSIVSLDEYVTPREEIPEPCYFHDTKPAPTLATTGAQTNLSDANKAQSTSPSPISNAKPASISAAKFRQAARQRGESGTIPTIDTIQGGSGFVRPPRSRTPSQGLAAMEAVLAQTHTRNYRPTDPERRKSADPVSLTAAASAANINKDDSQPRKRGFFIVVEGLDRAGKSTQVDRLAEHLQAKAIKFPERTTAIGQMINSYLAQTSDLDDQAIHLLFSANRWECVASIKNTLEAGESIVCDRYAFSGIAYSVAKGLSYDWSRNPDVGLPLPDLTMFLDLDAQTAAARGGYGEERYEKLEFQAKVREAFTRVSQDVKSHGGRWVTIDASKTLDQVTDDIQKAVQRVTSSIDRVGVKLGKLFVSERPANQHATCSSELFPLVAVIPNVKRYSLSSEDSGRRGKSFDQPRIQVNPANTNGTFPASHPSSSPLSYTEQLAAVRSAAAGTLSGLFGGSNAALDQQNPSAQPEADGPSFVNAARGQGFDSARVLGKHTDGNGRRRTLIDVIGEIKNQQPGSQQTAWSDHRRSLSAAAESVSPTTTQFPADGYPSSLAQGGRVGRSTDQGRVSQLPTIASSGAQPNMVPRQTCLTVQSGSNTHPEGASVSSPTTPAIGADRPLASPLGMRAASFSSADPRASIVSPAARTASPAITNSSRSSIAIPPPITRSASAAPATSTDYVYPTPSFSAPVPPPPSNANISDPNSLLNAQHLSMLNAQQGQAELQEQYMRNYMAIMANPMLAQQAHYQMMLQRRQQQYYGRAASAIGVSNMGANAGANGNGVQPGSGPPLAAFMQPTSKAVPSQTNEASKVDGSRTSTNVQRERRRSTHKQTLSSGSLLENTMPVSNGPSRVSAPASSQQPMLSMMMAPPPASHGSVSVAGSTRTASLSQQYYQPPQQMYAQPMFCPNAGGQQAFVPMMGGGRWPGAGSAAQMAGGFGGRSVYPSTTRSEIATPSAGLRTQRSKDDGLSRSQQQQQP